jgi:hypothetical protein
VLDSPNSGWTASVYVADKRGAVLADWGSPIASVNGTDAGQTTIDLAGAHGTKVLLWFTKLGKSTGTCSAGPYQQAVNEVSVAS